MTILVLHGPNLNKLGSREPDIYGSQTLEEINDAIKKKARDLSMQVDIHQDNDEGPLVNYIQNAEGVYAGIILNAAAYTHTSIAIRDAIATIHSPVIEVHISNIYKREKFRHKSYISDVCVGQISGLGYKGYLLALEYFSS